MAGSSPSVDLPDEATLEQHLRGLDRESLTGFVADLWAARGFDTVRTDDVVEATDDGDTLRVGVVADAGRLPFAGPSAPPDVDVVVAPGGLSGAPDDVEVVDAGDLAGMLRYAVDGPAAADLCERHLGGPPSGLSLSPLARVRARLAAVSGWSVAAVVVAAVLATWAVASLSGGPASTPGTPTPTSGVDTPTSTPDPSGAAAVPGLDDGGITNVSALGAAHYRALSGQSYTMWINYYRESRTAADDPTYYRHTRLSVEGDRYVARNTLDMDTRRLYTTVAYRGSEGAYLNNLTRATRPAVRLAEGEASMGRFGSPESFQRTLALRYLQVKSSKVTGWTTVDERTVYRVEGHGAPVTATAPGVSNYTVVALVDRRGMIHELTASFVVETAKGAFEVDLEVTLGRFGETSVREPAWYDRATERTPTPTPNATPSVTSTPSAMSTPSVTSAPTLLPPRSPGTATGGAGVGADVPAARVRAVPGSG